MKELQPYIARTSELEKLLKQAEQKSDILTNLLKEASADFNQTLERVTTSEENFRAIFENAPEAIYIIDVETHRILDCNPFTAKWLGYPRQQLLSAKVEDILERGASGIPENIRKALDAGKVHIQERRFQKRDGSLADAEITGTLIEYQERPVSWRWCGTSPKENKSKNSPVTRNSLKMLRTRSSSTVPAASFSR